MEVAESRPPYVLYETRAIEDRAATIEAGYYKTKDVDFAIITPQGSKDRVERNVADWFEHLTQQVQEQRFKSEWLNAFRSGYSAWKEGREIPADGTSVRNWPVASPSQVKQLLDAKIRTVEDLAIANEASIAMLGMGGRNLKEKAVSWLNSASGNGKITEEMASLKVALETAQTRNALLEGQLKDLSAQVAALAKK